MMVHQGFLIKCFFLKYKLQGCLKDTVALALVILFLLVNLSRSFGQVLASSQT
jgi:hypothetical protein